MSNQEPQYTSFEMEVVSRLARIEQKQNEFVEWRKAHDGEQGKMDSRVASLEESRSHANGAIAVLYIFFTAGLGALIKKWFN